MKTLSVLEGLKLLPRDGKGCSKYRGALGRRDRVGPFLRGFRSGIGLDTNTSTRPRSGLNILRNLPQRALKLKRKMPGVGSGCYLVLGNILDEFGANSGLLLNLICNVV